MGGVHGRGLRSLLAVGCVLAATACSSSPEPAGGSAAGSVTPPASGGSEDPGAYLALGDSVPFGFRAGEDAATYQDPTAFVGYPELLAEELGLEVVNAACPGETTESFIDATAQSNGCQDTLSSDTGFRTAFPLHVDYDSADQAQLDYALSTLQRDDVELVTVQIGANDAFLCQQTTADRCQAEVGTVATAVQTNVDHVLATLRRQGGYDGTIVVVTYYALDYSGWEAAATQLLDDVIAEAATANDALVADGYEAFRPAAEAAGGSSVAAGLVLPGDVHPTAEGQRLLADAVAAVVPG
jgi:lysophospholipase L1-like esterase